MARDGLQSGPRGHPDSIKRIGLNYKRANEQINQNIQFLNDSNLQPPTIDKDMQYMKDLTVNPDSQMIYINQNTERKQSSDEKRQPVSAIPLYVDTRPN